MSQLRACEQVGCKSQVRSQVQSQVRLAPLDRCHAWRRPLRHVLILLAATGAATGAAIGAALVLAACSGAPRKVTVPAPLVGKWFGQNAGDAIEFTDSGVFVLELRGVDPLIGRCVFKGTRITLRYQLGSIICPEEPGEYTLEVDGPSLKFIDAVDTCNSRRDAFAQSWRKGEQG